MFKSFNGQNPLIPDPAQIPLITPASASQNACPCSNNNLDAVCSGGPYKDYYFNPPYTGSAPNSTYLPPLESVPVILDSLTQIHDDLQDFLNGAQNQQSGDHQALYVKQHFPGFVFILQAIDKAANSTSTL